MTLPTCYTIGHSNHTIEKFIKLLKQNSIDCLIDVRSSPYSRHVPQYNKENLERDLKSHEIRYIFMGQELGARHTATDLLFPEGGVDFSKVRDTQSFKQGILRVIDGIGKGFKIALMCAEKDPMDCHRFALVSYALRESGISVWHILEDGTAISNEDLEVLLLKKQRKNILTK